MLKWSYFCGKIVLLIIAERTAAVHVRQAAEEKMNELMKKYDKIILASQSPRRLEILRKHGIEPVVMPTDANEDLGGITGMRDAVEELARRKAEACPASSDASVSSGRNLIIAADTIVYKDGIMGKPKDHDDAVRMLRAIRNTIHFVATGVCLVDTAAGKRTVFSEVTEVHCTDYSDEEIEKYIASEQPYDKAGSYAIQGPFRKYIESFEGDYENVVGLPYSRLEREAADL